MRLALIPFNPIIADLDANAARIAEAALDAHKNEADLAVFPELALTGYPPRDLLLRDDFITAAEHALDQLTKDLAPMPTVLGTPRRADGVLYNAAVLLRDGRVELAHNKALLPNYDVFDEPRYFTPGDATPTIFELAGERVALTVCEDLWRAADVPAAPSYTNQPDPIAAIAAAKPALALCLSASPFVQGKDERQQRILETAATRISAPIASINQLGGNDDLIFDGAAHFAKPNAPCLSSPRFSHKTRFIDTSSSATPNSWNAAHAENTSESLWNAITLGIRDYTGKTGFSSVVLGLSGGIDSALVCALAASALSPENVLALSMPSRYSSGHSRSDARAQAKRTNVALVEIPIEAPHSACESLLAPHLPNAPVAEENIQARLRGLTVMALANARNALALATGNKSELAVGYCTLYGDMNGALAPIADLYKTQVYDLARWINKNPAAGGFSSPPIPENVLTKPPSAELRPNQTDQDSLPPYDVLDAALKGLIEDRLSPDNLAKQGRTSSEVTELAAEMLHKSEHKRRQMPIGLKLSAIAFGPGRRTPIAKAREATQAPTHK